MFEVYLLRHGQTEWNVEGRLQGHLNWEGMRRTEIRERNGEAFRAREADKWNVPAPDGESYRDVAERMMSWLSELQNERVIAVSHGCAGRILRGVHAGLDYRAISELEERHEAVHRLRDGGLVEELN